MKRSLLYRISVRLIAYLNLLVGKTVDALTRAGLYGKVKYTVKGHFGDVIEVTHPYPANYNPADKARFDEWKQYHTFPHNLFGTPDVLLTSDGIVLSKLRTFIPALPHPVFRYQYGLLYNLRVRLFYSRRQFPHDKKYLLVYDNWSWNNYFHWVIDSMCRLQLLHEHVKEQFTVVVPEASPAYITETLALYGFTDIVRLPARSKARIPQLFTMNYAAWSGQQHPQVLADMVRYVKQQYQIADVPTERRVYVSRSRAYSRRVANEEAVTALLREYNFETVYFEGMPFAEQVKLMSTVRVFVTSHGANMTNLIWLPRDAKILELLREPGRSNFCYWSVASSLHLEYNYQLCPITDHDNIEVDIALLRRNLEACLLK
jgi:hypothetical protein